MENINYWGAVGAAWDRMKVILFQPFNIEKWFIMGFAAWIAGLNSSGGGGGGGGGGGNGFNFSDPGPGHAGGGGFESELSHFWSQYGVVIVMVGAIAALIILALSVAFAWLHARGKFIFLDNVLHNRGAISDPWKKYRKQGNSLFFWNLAIGFIGLLTVLLCLALCIPMILLVANGGSATGLGILGIVLAVLLLMVYSIAISFVQMLVYDFVMPIMLKYDLRIREAWSRFNTILQTATGSFVLYALVRLLLGMIISSAVLLAGLVTCCCLLFIAAIPYLGAVLLLPIFVFVRLVGIEFLRQFGENIDDVVAIPDEEPLALP